MTGMGWRFKVGGAVSSRHRTVTLQQQQHMRHFKFHGNSYTEREGDIEAYKNLCLFWRQSSLRNWKLILVISIVSSYTQSIGISSFSPTPMRSPCWNLIYLFLQCFLVMISHLFIVFFAYWVDFVPGGYLYPFQANTVYNAFVITLLKTIQTLTSKIRFLVKKTH